MMSVASMVLAVLLAGCTAGVVYLVFRLKLRAAAAEAMMLRDRIATIEADLSATRQEGNGWREKAELEREARATAEASASRVNGLEAALAQHLAELVTLTAARSALKEQAERVPGLESQIHDLNRQLVALSAAVSGFETKLAEQEQAHREKVDALTAIRGEIEKDLKNIAADSLRANQASFLELANEVLDKHKEGAAADLDARRQAVEALVTPVREALQACQTNLVELEKNSGPNLRRALR